MSLAGLIQPILKTVAIADLRPTQMTVGMREVERKRRDWQRRKEAADAGEYPGAHMIPAVLGPGDQLWMLDHHHLALALHLEGVEQVLVSIVAHLAHLPRKRFLAFLDASNYASIWTGMTVGVNWFVRKYAIRYAFTYTVNNNVVGVTGLYENVARLQAQFAW